MDFLNAPKLGKSITEETQEAIPQVTKVRNFPRFTNRGDFL